MEPPAPFPPWPGPGAASPAAVAAALARHLAGRGITGIYTATTYKFAVISVTAGLTVWTNGQQLWCTCHGQRHTWPAADIEAAASRHRRPRPPLTAAPGPPGSRITESNHDDALTDTGGAFPALARAEQSSHPVHM